MNPKFFLLFHLLVVALVFLIALFAGISLIRKRLRNGYSLTHHKEKSPSEILEAVPEKQTPIEQSLEEET